MTQNRVRSPLLTISLLIFSDKATEMFHFTLLYKAFFF